MLVYECIKSFCAGKKPDEQVFETLSPPDLNRQLSDLMKGLTAKVFRTFNASVTLEKELPSAEELEVHEQPCFNFFICLTHVPFRRV